MGKGSTYKRTQKRLNTVVQSFAKDLRCKATDAEIRFKEILDKHEIRYSFQHPFQRGTKIYILDFYLIDYATIVEIDGKYHHSIEQQKADAIRTAEILKKDRYCRLIRFDNEEVLGDEQLLLQKLAKKLVPWLK